MTDSAAAAVTGCYGCHAWFAITNSTINTVDAPSPKRRSKGGKLWTLAAVLCAVLSSCFWVVPPPSPRAVIK